MNSLTTAMFGNYRNGEFLQFMKNVVTIYNNYNVNDLQLNDRMDTLHKSIAAMDEVFMSNTAHELTPELLELDKRRDKALMGIKLFLDSQMYKEEEEVVKAAEVLKLNYVSHGDRIDKLSYQQQTAVTDALMNDWESETSLLNGINLLGLNDWVSSLKVTNTEFNRIYVARALTAVSPVKIDEKRMLMRDAYLELTQDTASYARVSADKNIYQSIINSLNALIDNYNTAIAQRMSGRNSDTEGRNNTLAQSGETEVMS